MGPVELHSYILKIQNTYGLALNNTLDEIFSMGDFPNELIPSIITAVKSGKGIPAKSMCNILIFTKDPSLYRLAKSKDLLSGWELTRLFIEGFTIPEIEEDLCQEIYKYFKEDSQPLRNEIVKAMAEHGGKASLDMLKVINYELAPTLPEHKYDIFKNSMSSENNKDSFLKEFSLIALEEFINQVQMAIDKISKRIEVYEDAMSSVSAITNHDLSNRNDSNVIEESKYLELKSSLQWSYKGDCQDKSLEHAVLKSIAGFSNTEGGEVLIGVDDNGNVLGLEKDYSIFSGKRDGFQRHLSQIISNAFDDIFESIRLKILFPKHN